MHLPQRVPVGFHGNWAARLTEPGASAVCAVVNIGMTQSATWLARAVRYSDSSHRREAGGGAGLNRKDFAWELASRLRDSPSPSVPSESGKTSRWTIPAGEVSVLLGPVRYRQIRVPEVADRSAAPGARQDHRRRHRHHPVLRQGALRDPHAVRRDVPGRRAVRLDEPLRQHRVPAARAHEEEGKRNP